MKLKMEKLLKSNNSKKNQSDVDDKLSHVHTISEKNAIDCLFKDINSHALTPSGDVVT